MLKRARQNINHQHFFGATSSLMDFIPQKPKTVNLDKTVKPTKLANEKYISKRVDGAKKVIYTCITGGYDTLYTPTQRIEGYDYICFTDNPNMQSKIWEFRPIPEELLNLNLVKQQRIVKICPHKYLSEYDMSIWMDGSIRLSFDFDNFIKSFVDDTHNIFVKRHPARKCIYDEANVCIKMNKDNKDLMQKQVKTYKEQGFPSNFGLAETNFIVRFHNEEDCVKLMDLWASELIDFSKRDQLSFNYCVWKTNTKIKYFPTSPLVKVTRHIKKKELKPRTNDDVVNFCIIEYNTPKILNCLIKSINKFVPKNHIYVFENSDKEVFKNTYDNVTVFDNTKGKIINFNNFLSKYKDRNKSNGRRNAWGSAKHCLSVDMCMNLIDGNFILLDSDVLLKKDVSNLFNDNYLYVAETMTQPLSTIKRILPFICFINNKRCKELGIRYFDDNYMHGLRKTTLGDRYDTGANFYLKAHKYEHYDIICNEFIEHMKGGSWVKNKLTPDEWLEKYKKYWN